MVWYLEWSAYALRHGHQLLFSTWLFHPTGLNLLTDTSVPALGLALSPVTLLAGPVAAINVASTLIPALTAFSMFWLLRRWVRWTPAAFVGGLLYGFSPLVVVQLAFGWLNLACLALLPLIVACFDELYLRQRRRAVSVGAALAALMAVEFFISTEMVLLISIAAALGTVVLMTYGWLAERDAFRSRRRHAVGGLVVAVVLASALLAYPVWSFVAGPAHLTGMLWSTNVPGDLGNAVGNFWSHLGRWGPLTSQQLVQEARFFGGYRGPAFPSPSYLGPGLLLVLAAGTVLWRSDRRLLFFALLGLLCAALSLRVTGGTWVPWSVVTHLAALDNVVQSRFDAVFVLCAAVMAAIVVDRTRSGLLAHRRRRLGRHRPSTPDQGKRRWEGARAAAGATVVALVAVVPMIGALGPNLPLTVQAVRVPHWFTSAGARLTPADVVLTYPFATADSQTSIPWQAISGLHFTMAGGGGPTGTAARAGANRTGFTVLDAASVPFGPAPSLSPTALGAVRKAMSAWGVTMVVVPDDAGLSPFQIGRGTAFAIAFFTAVLGKAPSRQDDAWVWGDVTQAPPPLALTQAAFNTCVKAVASSATDGDPWARCIARTARTSPVTSGPGQ
jgi:hypothetical protein